MYPLAFWCLALLGLSPLLGLGALGFWQILRLVAVVVGLTWLLWRQRRGQRLPWGEVVVPLVFMFTLTQFVQESASAWMLLASLLLVGLAMVGTSRGLLPLSRLDRWVLVIGCLAITASLATQFTLGLAAGQLHSERWWGPIYLLELLLVYLATSRLVRGPEGKVFESRLLAVTGAALLVAGAFGLWQIGGAVHHSGQAAGTFAAGHYDRAATHVASLQPQDQGLAFGPLGVEHTVEQLAALAKGEDAWMALGDIAAQEALWYSAQSAYQQVYQQDPAHPAVCARLGLALLETAKVDSAITLLRQGITQPGAGVENYLALAVGLVRTGAWEEANQALDAALQLGGLRETLVGGGSGNRIEATIGTLLPPLVLRHAQKVTLFDITQLLESRGWRVLHPAMKVGETKVSAPLTITALSGGGSSAVKEQIIVGTEGVSRHIRGYNIAVIEPQNGKVDTVAWFDQSNTRAVAGFLSSVPEGHIVAVTSNEDIAMSMTPEVWEELGRLGGALGVGHGWSYALIGVRGAKRGEGVERRSDRTLVVAGVLGANITADTAGNPAQLEAALREAAAKAPAGIAVYLPSLEPEARLIAVRR